LLLTFTSLPRYELLDERGFCSSAPFPGEILLGMVTSFYLVYDVDLRSPVEESWRVLPWLLGSSFGSTSVLCLRW
jgi:hypothetical protein